MIERRPFYFLYANLSSVAELAFWHMASKLLTEPENEQAPEPEKSWSQEEIDAQVMAGFEGLDFAALEGLGQTENEPIVLFPMESADGEESTPRDSAHTEPAEWTPTPEQRAALESSELDALLEEHAVNERASREAAAHKRAGERAAIERAARDSTTGESDASKHAANESMLAERASIAHTPRDSMAGNIPPGKSSRDNSPLGNSSPDPSSAFKASPSTSTHSQHSRAAQPPNDPPPAERIGSNEQLDIERYLARAYASEEELRERVDTYYKRADLAALEAALADLPSQLPPLTRALSAAEMDRWLEFYADGDLVLTELTATIRQLTDDSLHAPPPSN